MAALVDKGRRLYAAIVGERKPPTFVARGWAIGMFIGCAVPFGFQLIVSVPLSVLLKGSRTGAVLGTFVTNPVTIFFIYPLQTWIADRLFLSGTLSYENLKGVNWTYETLRALGTETFLAFILGGLLLAVLLTPVTYLAILKIVKAHRRRTGKTDDDDVRTHSGDST